MFVCKHVHVHVYTVHAWTDTCMLDEFDEFDEQINL